MDIIEKYKQQYADRDWSFLDNLDENQLNDLLKYYTEHFWPYDDITICEKCLFMADCGEYTNGRKIFCDRCAMKKYDPCDKCNFLILVYDIKQDAIFARDYDKFSCCDLDKEDNFFNKKEIKNLKHREWYKHCFPIGQSVITEKQGNFTFNMKRKRDAEMFEAETRFNHHENFASIKAKKGCYKKIYYKLDEKGVASPDDIVIKLMLINRLPLAKLITKFYLQF